jgi:SOS-response transcriptional repressor LexA
MHTVDERTQAVFDFIRHSLETDHISPTLREIGTACFLTHTAVIPHLARLEAWGWIVRDIGKARSIRLGEFAPEKA